MSWRLALIEFLSTPGPDRKSAELCGHQFKGIIPILNPSVNKKDADLFQRGRKKKKIRFDPKNKQLPVLFIGSNVSYINTDLRSWSIGTIHARSHDDRSYQILTENGLIISRNPVHLRPTGVKPVDRLAKPCIPNVKSKRPIVVPSEDPALHNAVKASKPCSTKNTAKTNDVPYRIRSGREVCKPPHYRDYACNNHPIKL